MYEEVKKFQNLLVNHLDMLLETSSKVFWARYMKTYVLSSKCYRRYRRKVSWEGGLSEWDDV